MTPCSARGGSRSCGLRRADLLVVGAHPDDPEHIAGGTTALATDRGKKVVWCVVTTGARWHVDPHVVDPTEITRIRSAEAAAAAKLLGVDPPIMLGEQDGQVCAARLAPLLLEVMRAVQADRVITHGRAEGHPDHRGVLRAVLRCCNRRGEPLPLANPRWRSASPPYAGPTRVFLGAGEADLDRPETAFVDIGPVIDRKIAALAAHASQVHDVGVLAGVVRQTAVGAGRAAGVQYAEAFRPAPGYVVRRVYSDIPE